MGDRDPGREHCVQIPLLPERLPEQRDSRRRLADLLKASPSPDWLKKLQFSSPLKMFRRTLDRREEISLSVPSPVGGGRRRFHVQFLSRIDWRSLFRTCKEWLKNPMNIALLIWLLCVAVSGTMLGLLLLGLLNDAFPTKSLRNHWIEINNQVLNALFTLMSLYQHPNLFYHLVMLCRWNSEDITELRKMYCKNAGYRPHEWAHMMVVLALLNITCFAQYALCGLYWGYSRAERPEFLENFFFALGIAAPVFAALYAVYSPLGREYDCGSDEESLGKNTAADTKRCEKHGLKLYDRRVVVSKPEWVGGLFDCRDDATACYLSFFCTCCVFGWNMERLGLGNMYVHVATFLLLCVAPFWIFNIAALNIHNYVIGDVIGIAGVVLCAFGLLYGGFWRIQMRRRFRLPGDAFCLGYASLTDYVKWMFCWACALAQEVRTGNFYDVEDDSLFRKLMNGEDERQTIAPETRDGSEVLRGDATTPPVQPSMGSEDVVGGANGSTQLPPASFSAGEEAGAPSSI
ncbi:hypothetical protein MUK42_12497 [Musa troglodytarum]|uniref:PLAC8 family protein n=1 Tax=Musa troglodytarum TaxID=320322 RepID=A0A9E7KLQ9_9LILI|nr:hypothetical protein MUK42_12497 [Musa troglodytarum]